MKIHQLRKVSIVKRERLINFEVKLLKQMHKYFFYHQILIINLLFF